MADGVAKVVDSTKVSFLPSYPCAVSWSLDDRVSVLTDRCIYIFTLRSSSESTKAGISREKTSVSSAEKHLVLDVGIDRVQVIPEPGTGPVSWSHEKLMHTFDCALNAKPTGQLQHTGFSAAAWSPLGCDKNQRCLLASLSIDHQLTLHSSPTAMLGNWESMADLTTCLHDFLKLHDYQINDYINSDDENLHATADVKPSFSEFSRRVHLLAFTCMVWCPVLYTVDNNSDVSSTDSSNCTTCEKFALVAAGTRSGHVAFFKVIVPVLDSPASVSVIGFLKPQSLSICCLAWHFNKLNRGILAAGTSDGLVKVFSLRVSTSLQSTEPVTCTAEYTLWGSKDSMPVLQMTWLPQERTGNTLNLAVTKGPVVILFEILTEEGQLVQRPTYKLVRGIHCQSISGQSCSSQGIVYTCGIRGTMQRFSADKPDPVAIKSDIKPSRSCHGMSVSSNGLFMVVLHSPSRTLQLRKDGTHLQVSIVSLATPSVLSEAVQALAACLDPKKVRWDLLEGVRQVVVEGPELPEVLSNVVLKEAIESCPMSILYLRRHLVSLLATRDEQDEETVKGLEPSHGWGEELARVENRILEIQVFDSLNSWLTGQKNRETNEADESSALVMSDWFIQRCSDQSSIEIAQQVYDACDDVDGTRALSVIRAGRLAKGNNLKVRVMSSEHDSEATPLSKRKKTEFSAQKQNTQASRNPIEKSADFSSGTEAALANGDKPSDKRTPAEADSSGALTLAKNFPSETEEAADDEITIRLPTREKCNLCGSGIPFKELKRGTCVSGHSWKRCLVSHCVCSDFSHRRCVNCGGCVSLPSCKSSVWQRRCLEAVVCCPVCSNWLV